MVLTEHIKASAIQSYTRGSWLPLCPLQQMSSQPSSPPSSLQFPPFHLGLLLHQEVSSIVKPVQPLLPSTHLFSFLFGKGRSLLSMSTHCLFTFPILSSISSSKLLNPIAQAQLVLDFTPILRIFVSAPSLKWFHSHCTATGRV